jgi:hypothetical protein
LSNPTTDAALTSDGKYLASIGLTLQAVIPDSNQIYRPSQAQDFLFVSAGGLGYGNQAGNLTLRMSGMAPNFMGMSDIHFVLGTVPAPSQKYGPRYGMFPSTSDRAPLVYQLNGSPPDFLDFDGQVGSLRPDGRKASVAMQQGYTLAAANNLGQAMANFTIAVQAAAT